MLDRSGKRLLNEQPIFNFIFMGEHRHERKEFESEDEGWKQASRAPIGGARVQSERAGGSVDPQTIGLREEDYPDGKINPALKAAIDKERGTVNTAASAVAEPGGPTETVEVDPRLTTFKADYDTSKNPKLTAFPWTEIQNRLLADEGVLLNAALELNERGILFGVDINGNPLICDRGDQPVMTGMNYPDTRQRVLFKHDTYDKKGKMLKDDNGQPIPTGYEMFPYVEPHGKSDEIMQYEAHTGRPFILPPDGEIYQSSWAESGENPSWPRSVYSFSNLGDAYVYAINSLLVSPRRGVRRLLRVVKKA